MLLTVYLGCKCLFGPSSCALCCGQLPAIRQSTGTKIMYSIFLVSCSLTAVLTHADHIKQLVVGSLWSELENNETKNIFTDAGRYSEICTFILRNVNQTWIAEVANDVDIEVDYDANGNFHFTGNMCNVMTKFSSELVYFIFISITCFHLLLALITVNVKHSKQVRAKIHNGFWMIKVIVCLGIWAAFVFNWSVGVVNSNRRDAFVYTWMYVGRDNLSSINFVGLQFEVSE